MKKKLLIATLLLTASSLVYAGYTYRRCMKILDNGQQCKRGVSNANDYFCWQHKN